MTELLVKFKTFPYPEVFNTLRRSRRLFGQITFLAPTFSLNPSNLTFLIIRLCMCVSDLNHTPLHLPASVCVAHYTYSRVGKGKH